MTDQTPATDPSATDTPDVAWSFERDHEGSRHTEGLVTVLDLQAGLPDVIALRAWVLEALSPQPGQTAVDVGSGTGEDVQALALRVGREGSAIGVEPHAQMRAEAERRAAAAGSTARFVDGAADALPFEDESVDVLRCERVFQHLSDPDAAAVECARVLRPGAVAAVVDSDWGTALIHPGDPEVIARLHMHMLTSAMPNPMSGRRLGGQLRRAGLVVTDVGSRALLREPEAATGPFAAMMTRGAVQTGAVTQAEADALIETLVASVESGEFHMSVTMFAYIARKP
jgi:SAM-dependent methyltransferase